MKDQTTFALRDIDDLIPYARNARTHSADQIAKIAGSIKEFGFLNPVIISSDGGILAGHGRILAAQKLGLKKIPCIQESHLTEIQRRAYILADNRIALDAEWDEEMLRLELNDLQDLDVDLSSLAFDDDELRKFSEMSTCDPLDVMPSLVDGDKKPFQQMSFTLSDNQAEIVKTAIKKAKENSNFDLSENSNCNGNAITLICSSFLEH